MGLPPFRRPLNLKSWFGTALATRDLLDPFLELRSMVVRHAIGKEQSRRSE
jgi:hypothetical protein